MNKAIAALLGAAGLTVASLPAHAVTVAPVASVMQAAASIVEAAPNAASPLLADYRYRHHRHYRHRRWRDHR